MRRWVALLLPLAVFAAGCIQEEPRPICPDIPPPYGGPVTPDELAVLVALREMPADLAAEAHRNGPEVEGLRYAGANVTWVNTVLRFVLLDPADAPPELGARLEADPNVTACFQAPHGALLASHDVRKALPMLPDDGERPCSRNADYVGSMPGTYLLLMRWSERLEGPTFLGEGIRQRSHHGDSPSGTIVLQVQQDWDAFEVLSSLDPDVRYCQWNGIAWGELDGASG